jgi:hypothetical protein
VPQEPLQRAEEPRGLLGPQLVPKRPAEASGRWLWRPPEARQERAQPGEEQPEQREQPGEEP